MNTEALVSDSLVRALGWALAHSLWQASIVALLLLLLMSRLKTAKQRYNAAYASLSLVLLSAIATAIWVYEPVEEVQLTETSPFEWALNVNDNALQDTYWQSFSGWLEANHALIVVLWLLGFGFFMLRLFGGLWQVQRLRTRGIRTPEADWLEHFDVLQHRLGLKSAVTLLESKLVQTPMAIGWLKPVVLLPIGLVNRLSVAEVEAVLAHELAHIARRDWIFNLLQAFIETLFYYHPAVWWISAVVRRERENCCDDAALAATGNPLAFAKALVQVQEMAVPVPVLALGLSGPRRRPLLDRVRRILNQPQQRQHQVMEKITATVILLALLALVGLKANSVPSIEAAFSQISDIPNSFFSTTTDEDQMESDSLPKPKNTRKITREDDDQKVEAEYQDGKLTRLRIDGKDIPESEFEAHESLTEELMEYAAPPAPPAPPTPPGSAWGAQMWEFPAAPAAPRAYGFSAPPYPPTPPFPAMEPTVLVFSGKDADGNGVISLQNDGETKEIIIKNNEVYVDGKKLEKGESLSMPGIYIGSEGEFYSYSYNDSDADERVYQERAIAGSRKELKKQYEEDQREIKRQMKDDQRAIKREMKEAQRDMERSQKEWEKDQKQWAKEQETWAKDQKVWAEEQKQWAKEQKVWEQKSKMMEKTLKEELLKDGLISNTNNFSLEINDKVLKINKKEQSREMHKKYRELIEGINGQKLNGNGSYMYNYTDDK